MTELQRGSVLMRSPDGSIEAIALGVEPVRKKILRGLEAVEDGFRAFFEGSSGSLRINSYDMTDSGTALLSRERGGVKRLVAAEISPNFYGPMPQRRMPR